MKNLTTLSLITATIIGLTGCGGGESTSTPSEDKIELSSIKELSEASKKHKKSDWIAIENSIQNLDNTEGFNSMLLSSIDKNIATLNAVGVEKEEAYVTNSDLIYEDLINLEIEELDNQVVEECKEDETCKEEAYSSLYVDLTIDKEEAYAIASDINLDSKEPNTLNGLIKEFTCKTGLVKKVHHYGVADNFSTANGIEEANASMQVATNPSILAYNNGIGLSPYDTTLVNRIFAEEIKNIPSTLNYGRIYIGLENHGGNDTITLGNIDTNSTTTDFYSSKVIDLDQTQGWTKNTHIYSKSLSSILLNDGTNLQNYAKAHGKFDVYVQDDTYVDFIAVATCVKPDPIEEITGIVNKFECSEKETLLQILGGTIDAFNSTSDAPIANPSTALSNEADSNSIASHVGYDTMNIDRHFAETLRLPTGLNIHKAELNIGYKSLNSSLYTNDALYVGFIDSSSTSNYAGGHLYDNNNPISAQNWSQTTVTGGEVVAKADLNLIVNNSGLTSGTVLNTLQTQNALDIYLQDDTAVDFTQLNLCVSKKPCGEEISIDLSQLDSWTNRPDSAIEENVFNGTEYQGVWDDTLNWFNFGSNNSDATLEIPFCACGNTEVNIAHFKADNNATINLDSTLLVSQQGHDQDAMKRDDWGGNHVDGSQSVQGTGTGVNHTLTMNVHNFGSYFGAGVEGKLEFRGHLGTCKEATTPLYETAEPIEE